MKVGPASNALKAKRLNGVPRQKSGQEAFGLLAAFLHRESFKTHFVLAVVIDNMKLP